MIVKRNPHHFGSRETDPVSADCRKSLYFHLRKTLAPLERIPTLSRSVLREVVHDLFQGRCCWCGKRVFLSKATKKGHLRHDASTVDHVDQRNDGNRKARCRVVCSCHQCNQKRSHDSYCCLLKVTERPADVVPDGMPVLWVDEADELILDQFQAR
jgi:hypothetical protein